MFNKIDETQTQDEYDVVPLQQVNTQLTMILDLQGIVRRSVSYTPEEGEIIHDLTDEQLAEMFRLNPNELVKDAPEVDVVSDDELKDVDEIEIEDVIAKHYPKFTDHEGNVIPNLGDTFGSATFEKLEEMKKEREKDESQAQDLNTNVDLKAEWAACFAKMKSNACCQSKMPTPSSTE